jgi:hypothetical protein
LSVFQRCADIKYRYNIDVSAVTLRTIYDLHGIKMKKVMTVAPETPPHLMEKRLKEKRELKYSLEYVHVKQIPLYYLDEANFTVKDYQKYCWAHKHENVLIDFHKTPAAVSACIIIDDTGIKTLEI